MQKQIECLAPAKINWGLDIVGRRADGYHLLRSLMQTIDLADKVSLRCSRTDHCSCSPSLPGSASNLALSAWLQLKEEFAIRDGLDIRIEKRIPVAGGLAGGSTDAAAVLRGANLLFDLSLSREDLCRIGLKLGADLPFCLTGGLALVEGIGEQVTPQPASQTYYLVLANPGLPVSTAEVYRGYAEHKGGDERRPDLDGLLSALQSGDLSGIRCCCGNVLEGPAFALHPQIAELKRRCLAFGLPALMSGSGGSVWALAKDQAQAEAIADQLRHEASFACTAVTCASLPELAG